MKSFRITLAGMLPAVLMLASCAEDPDDLYRRMPKIDAHIHIRTAQQDIIPYAEQEGFRFLTICTGSGSQASIEEQRGAAKDLNKKHPDRISYLTTFSMENFEEPGWAEEVIRKLQKDFEEGAIGVKVWKDIGMTFRDSLGRFIFIDDPLFDPIFSFIAENNKTVVAHIGEPKNCWLPIDSMSVKNNKNYYREHPEYHMYLHSDHPSYEKLVSSRDNLLAKHPDLLLVGAHLGSLEWDVDELAERLDRFPGFAVDVSARLSNLQVQERLKVRDFIFRYQDRLIYGTDFILSAEDDFDEQKASLERKWERDWNYFFSDEEMESPNVDGSFRGLGLGEDVLRNIYYENAIRWFPEINR